MKGWWAFCALLASVLFLSCSGGYTGPVAGILTINLDAVEGDEGAVLLTISGGPVDSVEDMGHLVYSARVDPNTLRLVVTGDLSSGAIARIRIPDGRLASNYSARINQVAIRSTYAQRDPAAYQLSLGP